MRNLLFFTVIFCALGQELFGQHCSVVFNTQAEIDNFPSQNPGCTFADDVYISEDGVYNLDSLYVLDSVYSMSIYYTNITHLNGLSNIRFFDNLIIAQNPHLTDISGLHNVNKITFGLGISDNDSLVSLNGLNNLDSVGILAIGNNLMLNDIQALSSLKSVGDWLYIFENDKLIDFSAFNSLQELGSDTSFSAGRLTIANNNSVVDLGGFENLKDNKKWGLDISISGNRSLKSLPKFNKLTSLTGSLTIRNDSLVSLIGLDSLRSIKYDLIIGANKTLKDLKGLEHLQSVLGLRLDSMNITSLEGLNNLDTISSSLTIFDCDSLLYIDAIAGPGTNHIYNNLTVDIHDNALLSECAIDPVCNALINPHPGQITIQNNAPGCNSQQEVILACGGVSINVQLLISETCGTITNPVAVENGIISLSGPNQNIWQPTNAIGEVGFGYLDTSTFLLTLPQFPTGNWEVCQDTFLINPDTIAGAEQVVFL